MKNYITIIPMYAPARSVHYFDAKTARWDFTNTCIELKNSGFIGTINLYINGAFVKSKVFA